MDYTERFGGLGEIWLGGEYPPPGCLLTACDGEPESLTVSPAEEGRECA